MAETDYNEILLEAIDAIVVSRISEVNFDRTIVATIVDASKAKDGEYVLSDGSVQFTAHSGNDKYKENDKVNVLIPSNDFSSTEKTILGKTSANVNDVPVTYVSPLEKIVPMETNYAAGLKGGITANSETEIFQLTNAEWIKVNEDTLGYDTLCVSARFKTLLNDYDIRQGHYGLLIQLKTKNGYIHALTLDSAKDMFGNPYGYSMYMTQEQTYHLNLQDNIVGIKVDLYQMKDFKYNDGVNSELQVLPVMPYSNILVENINVSFGYNAEQVEDNTAKISTADSLTYDNIKDASVTKKLTLTWYNKDENNKYLGFSDGHFAGQNKDNPLYEIKWYHSQNNGEWALLSKFNDATIANVEMNLRQAINEYKAIVTYDGNEYSSNILSFKAETGYDSNIHDQLNMELELRNGKDSFDSYPFYGADSAVINPGDASKDREVEFAYSGALGSKLEPDVLNGATVSFYIPTISTMLGLPSSPEDGELQKESDLEGYALYQKKFSSYNEDNKQKLKTFRYRIKEFYNPLFNNNTVILKVIDKNGFEYSAKKTFSFSNQGASGTDYTLVIEDPINKKATLYDADYKVIKTEFEDKDWGYWPSPIGTGTPTAAAGYAVRKLSTTVKWVGKTVTLEAIKGIPWYPENSNYYYQGPTIITYDSAGVNPRYYAGDIELYDKNTNKPIAGLIWTLKYYSKNKLIKDPQTSINIQGYPQLLIDESGVKAPKLKASDMYFDQYYYLVLVANNSNGQVQWRQPLIILQNAYSSNLLNNWNGALSIDQGNNTILTAMVGAGSKDSNNRFSGVVMGNFGKLDTNGDISTQQQGLLGFHSGAESFGFKTDGTAFIGKSGKGRIEFNGDSGIIKSASGTGMSIDLTKGNITSSNFSLSANNGNFILNSHPEDDNPYFKIQADNENYISYNNKGLSVKGYIEATGLTLVSGANIKGLADVALTGKYDDLTGTPKIPTSVGDLGLDTSSIIFKGDITQKTATDKDGNSYTITTVPTSGGKTITYSTYDAEDYIVFGRSKGENIVINKEGLLTAHNALIYGTIYATDGEFTGTIKGSKMISGEININNRFIVDKDGNVTIPSGTIKIGDVTGSSDLATKTYVTSQGYQNESQVTTITKDTISTTNVIAENLQVRAANITGELTIGQLPSTVAETSDIPTKLSQFNNDSGYQTQTGVVSIVNGTVTADYVNALEITVKAANVTGTLSAATISANQIVAGDIGNSGNTAGITIAGWKIGNGYLYADYYDGFVGLYSNSPSITILGQTKDDWRIVAGGSGSRNFGVDKNGYLYAAAGYIGGFALQSNGSLSSDRTGSLSETSDGDTRIKLRGAYTGVGTVKSSLSPLALRIEDDNTKGISIYKNRLIYNGTNTSFPSLGTGIGAGILFRTDGGKLGGTWQTSSGSTITSDRNMKNTILPQSEIYSIIFDKLNPVTFKYNDGLSDRTHLGLIAQEMEEAVLSSGLTTKEFAAVCYDIDENGNKVNYGIRYEELVSMCIYEIQRLKERIAFLEN